MRKLVYNIAAFICKIYFILFYKMEVKGRENIPTDGKLVVVANHISYFDPPIIGSIMKRQVHFLAKEELFEIPFIGILLKYIGQIPVKRGKADRNAIMNALRILKEDKVLGIFPEGTTRKRKEKGLGKAKAGAVLIPIHSRSPVLPIGIVIRRKKIKVSIGKPFTMEKYYDIKREDRNKAGEFVMKKIEKEIRNF
ncbi:MAG: lysophospholipid acyltransferase family protein [Bacillota bacterium]